jgi:ammonia channel protein AmtB
MACLGLMIIYCGFWGFYAACNIPVLNIGTEDAPFFSATNIYLMPTTLSAITFNFILSLSGGLMVGYLISRADPYWTFSGGLAGIISASAGNDYYHPIQALIVAGVGVAIIYKLHYYVERRFKIDDGVGAVAVHGYAGVWGVVIAGFLLWGYPAAAPIEGSAAPIFGTTVDGFPAVNPIGNIIGAFIMFGVLGWAPAYVVARVLKAAGILRVPSKVELAGLDTLTLGDPYPYFPANETDFEPIERRESGLTPAPGTPPV